MSIPLHGYAERFDLNQEIKDEHLSYPLWTATVLLTVRWPTIDILSTTPGGPSKNFARENIESASEIMRGISNDERRAG